jgi:hypothetical protein
MRERIQARRGRDRKRTAFRELRIDHGNTRDHKVAAQAAFHLEVRNTQNGVTRGFGTASSCRRDRDERKRGPFERPAAADSFEKVQGLAWVCCKRG